MVDLISGQALFFGDDGEVTEGEVPPELQDDVEMFAEQLTETVAETDDDLVLKYLEGEGLTPEEVREGVKQGIASQQVIPVFACAATGDKGVRQLLDALVALLPAAAETSIARHRHQYRQGQPTNHRCGWSARGAGLQDPGPIPLLAG